MAATGAEERLVSSSLVVLKRHVREFLATEVRSVYYALKSGMAADL